MGGLLSIFKNENAQRSNNNTSANPPSKITEQDKAQLKLKQQRDRVKQYQKKLLILIDKEKQQAKIYIKEGEKSKALMILRKKKHQEKLLESALAQIENLEHMIAQVEFSQIEVKVFEGLKQGNAALDAIRQELSIEDVEQVMADAQELQSWANELGGLVGTPTADIDDDEIFTEFQVEVGEQPVADQKKTQPVEAAKEPKVPTPAQSAEQDMLAEFPEVPQDEPLILPEVPETEPVAPITEEQKEEAEPVPA
eukprot:m.16854 g.16854  ORF g.16854 m.16854 type:complete len:253 (+) comp8166_c1_seq1:322-1080(+)